MTELQIRRIPFAFDEHTPFQWNRENPRFGISGNLMSFIAPGFEKYIVAVTRDAQPLITDPAVAAEAEAFLRQEAQHARAHRLHTAALIAQYPGLRRAVDGVTESYDRLYAEESLEFGLAYVANIEATFSPLFGTWLEHPDQLFHNGEPKVASLMLWHYIEEIEHRSSAFTIFNAVVPNRLHRLRALPKVKRHVTETATMVMQIFDEEVPVEERLVPATRVKKPRFSRRAAPAAEAPAFPEALASVPKPALRRMMFRLLWSQWPWHDPQDERVPPIADRWRQAFAEGHELTDWYAFAGETG